MKQAVEHATAERLIDVAGEIFAAKGSAATVREICAAANCSVAAVNYHFRDKHQLYLRCVQAGLRGQAEAFSVAG